LNSNYDVINDVISGFAKVVVQRFGFHHRIVQTISCGDVVSVFSERELTFPFAICCRPSVCRLSVCRL